MAEHCYAEGHYAECHKNPLMLSVIMLSVVAPFCDVTLSYNNLKFVSNFVNTKSKK